MFLDLIGKILIQVILQFYAKILVFNVNTCPFIKTVNVEGLTFFFQLQNFLFSVLLNLF